MRVPHCQFGRVNVSSIVLVSTCPSQYRKFVLACFPLPWLRPIQPRRFSSASGGNGGGGANSKYSRMFGLIVSGLVRSYEPLEMLRSACTGRWLFTTLSSPPSDTTRQSAPNSVARITSAAFLIRLARTYWLLSPPRWPSTSSLNLLRGQTDSLTVYARRRTWLSTTSAPVEGSRTWPGIRSCCRGLVGGSPPSVSEGQVNAPSPTPIDASPSVRRLPVL